MKAQRALILCGFCVKPFTLSAWDIPQTVVLKKVSRKVRKMKETRRVRRKKEKWKREKGKAEFWLCVFREWTFAALAWNICQGLKASRKAQNKRKAKIAKKMER